MADQKKKIPGKRAGASEDRNDGEAEEKGPKRKRLERSGKMAEDALKPFAEAIRPKGEERQVEDGVTPEKAVLFPEDREKVVPIGWFFLVGLALAAVVGWMAFQILTEDGNAVAGNSGGDPAVNPRDPAQVQSDTEAARRQFEEIQAVVVGFLSAKTVEERAKFVRHRDRVLPLMRDFHETREFRTYSLRNIASFSSVAIKQRPFIVLGVETGEDQELPLLLEDSPSGIRVDWESFVCYQPIDPGLYLENRPLEPVTMRAYASVDNFHVYEFADEDQYGCLRLNFRNSDAELFGYVERGSETDQKLRQFSEKGGRVTRQPVIVRLRFLEGSKEKRCVLIEDVESFLWAYPENPTEK